ncbi:MAG: pirin family protein [Sphingomonadaceae bacterium]|nr:pirin family protein [Sphingomonadaceae bacterium]
MRAMQVPLEITPVSHDLGDFSVHRYLPQPQRVMVGPFIFVDQFTRADADIGSGLDVRPHPHLHLSTLTYLFNGAIDHRDSLGTFQRIDAGDINLMTAGRGIVHSERSPADQRAGGFGAAGMQTWLALPDGQEDIDPAFQNVGRADLPLIDDGQASARILMGSLWGKTAPTKQHAATIFADIALQSGGRLPVDAEADERALLLIDGAATLDDLPLEPFRMYVLQPGIPAKLTTATSARLILLGGQAFTTPRYAWWNFVSSDRSRIAQAREDWKAGRFPIIVDDADEFIPLPDQPNTNSHPDD